MNSSSRQKTVSCAENNEVELQNAFADALNRLAQQEKQATEVN